MPLLAGKGLVSGKDGEQSIEDRRSTPKVLKPLMSPQAPTPTARDRAVDEPGVSSRKTWR
jgi:hypothetical protein